MAAFSGKRGTFSHGLLTGAELHIASWTVNATADVADVSQMDTSAVAADKHFKTYVGGFKDWTATVELFDNQDGLADILSEWGTSDTIAIAPISAGFAYGGTAFLTGFSQSQDANGAPTVTLNFQGTGNMTAA